MYILTKQIAEWSNAQKVPGQFTGQKKATGLLGKDLHATGRQAWVKKVSEVEKIQPDMSDCGNFGLPHNTNSGGRKLWQIQVNFPLFYPSKLTH